MFSQEGGEDEHDYERSGEERGQEGDRAARDGAGAGAVLQRHGG